MCETDNTKQIFPKGHSTINSAWAPSEISDQWTAEMSFFSSPQGGVVTSACLSVSVFSFCRNVCARQSQTTWLWGLNLHAATMSQINKGLQRPLLSTSGQDFIFFFKDNSAHVWPNITKEATLLLWKLRCFLLRTTITHFPCLWCNSCVTQPLICLCSRWWGPAAAPHPGSPLRLKHHSPAPGDTSQELQDNHLWFVHQDVTAKTMAASRAGQHATIYQQLKDTAEPKWTTRKQRQSIDTRV